MVDPVVGKNTASSKGTTFRVEPNLLTNCRNVFEFMRSALCTWAAVLFLSFFIDLLNRDGFRVPKKSNWEL